MFWWNQSIRIVSPFKKYLTRTIRTNTTIDNLIIWQIFRLSINKLALLMIGWLLILPKIDSFYLLLGTRLGLTWCLDYWILFFLILLVRLLLIWLYFYLISSIDFLLSSRDDLAGFLGQVKPFLSGWREMIFLGLSTNWLENIWNISW